MNLKSRDDKRTVEQKREEFLQYLETYGNITKSAKRAKIGRKTIYNWLNDDPAFKKEFDISAKIGCEALEDEARRRAFEGVTKAVYQGGKKVGTVKEYSDTLLIFLMKGAMPQKYKDRVEHGGNPENPINHNVSVTRVVFEDMTEGQ